MRLLIDCDVVLDLLLNREPFAEDSQHIMVWAEQNPGSSAIAWHTVSNLVYLCKEDIQTFLKELLTYVEIPSTGTINLLEALTFDMPDFEDAMQVAAAEQFGAQMIVTRNVRDYRKAPIKALTPKDALKQLQPDT